MSNMKVDFDLIGKLADLMDEKGLTELELEEDDQKIRLQRYGMLAQSGSAAAPAAAATTPPAAAGEPTPSATDHSSHPGAVSAPMVGTIYLASQPGVANFVAVGDAVKEGQTLLIIEAMKVMNQIPAPRAGTVKQILVSDWQPVEFGEPLLIIE